MQPEIQTEKNEIDLGSKASRLTDAELAQWLTEKQSGQITVAYAHAKHLFSVFEPSSERPILIGGDLGTKSTPALKKLAKSKLLKRIELPYQELESNDLPNTNWALLDAQVQDVTALKKTRDELFGQGRGKAISPLTAAKVWHDAGGRCMYRGCGCDLGDTPLTTKTARIAYLAHIIASDPDGPRGNNTSHALSDSPENIMLMCDAHHRLIDRIDVNGHPTPLLQAMREEHSFRVCRLLDGLQYPSAQAITLLSDLGHVPTNVTKTHLFDCILTRKLGPLPEVKHMIRRTQRDDRGRTGFWEHFLHEHETDIRDLVTQTSNRPSQASVPQPDVLAIFPLHLVPILILSGRIIGEARNVEVFQYERDLKTWQWPKLSADQASSFDIRFEIDAKQDAETILSLELTANLDTNALPNELAEAINEKRVNWIRLTNSTPNPNCINSQESLDAFCRLARQAVATIQDSWRSPRVHIFGISPASSLFKFGQILQAGHHTAYRVYDRPDGATPFIPAIDITGNEVSSALEHSEQQRTISLR